MRNYIRQTLELFVNGPCNTNPIHITDSTINDNNAVNLFNHFLVIEKEYLADNKFKMFIPTYFYNSSVLKHWNRMVDDSYQYYVLPIIIGSKIVQKRTFKGIFSMINNLFYLDITKVTTKKDTFYIGNGIILDKDFNILFLLGLDMIFDRENKRGEIVQFKIKLSPKVFSQKNIINNNIIKNVLPHFTENTLYSPHYFNQADGSLSDFYYPCSVTIEDMEKTNNVINFKNRECRGLEHLNLFCNNTINDEIDNIFNTFG